MELMRRCHAWEGGVGWGLGAEGRGVVGVGRRGRVGGARHLLRGCGVRVCCRLVWRRDSFPIVCAAFVRIGTALPTYTQPCVYVCAAFVRIGTALPTNTQPYVCAAFVRMMWMGYSLAYVALCIGMYIGRPMYRDVYGAI